MSSKIIPRYFENMIYLDLLAGSGINRIKGTGNYIIGSPIIAATIAHTPFDELIFVESDKNVSRALNDRLSEIIRAEQYKVYSKKCDEVIDTIIEEHLDGNRTHYLAFIDCEGLDISWNTMENLLQCNGDLIFNFQTSQINRTFGKYKSGHIPEETMYRFFWRCGSESGKIW